MSQKVLLITPPFTQLNTPYPATAYLKGFLKTQGIQAVQADLGLEAILEIFSPEGLKKVFDLAQKNTQLSENSRRILLLQEEYIRTIQPVIAFLQEKNATLAPLIAERNYLPEASRFGQLEDLEWAFGVMGTRDKARHLATLYLEDLGDLLTECIDPHFGFSRYAERLGRCAYFFDDLENELKKEPSFTDTITLGLLDKYVQKENFTLVAFSVPFPGNLYSAFRCAAYLRKNYPHLKIALGGGFANTELRSVSDPRVFEYFHFITLDDGEAPILNLLQHLNGKRKTEDLKRTFCCIDNTVVYCNGSKLPDFKQTDVGTPDYSDLLLDRYLSVIEVTNPMHRLWSDGRWNKLTLAHGCYWGKCTFCDISLDYIGRYEFASARLLVDRIEEMIQQTGQHGFHFVDEAAPPVLMREVALEIIRRKLTISWWTNIRFEKSFTEDLCRLLALSGCIAVSGGLEVASDRLLQLIDKGVTVEQAARVMQNFTVSGIMVHAYLMYGFPTQTDQETIDSLEVVRQLFEAGVLQSGFWHRFAMTAHAPVGLDPEKFGVKRENAIRGTFANNDLAHIDPTGADHEKYSEGLRVSLFNYMQGLGFDLPLHKWFSFKITPTSHPKDLIISFLDELSDQGPRKGAKVYWLGKTGESKEEKKNKWVMELLNRNESFKVKFDGKTAAWLNSTLPKLTPAEGKDHSFEQWKASYELETGENFLLFWHSNNGENLRNAGLLVL